MNWIALAYLAAGITWALVRDVWSDSSGGALLRRVFALAADVFAWPIIEWKIRGWERQRQRQQEAWTRIMAAYRSGDDAKLAAELAHLTPQQVGFVRDSLAKLEARGALLERWPGG